MIVAVKSRLVDFLTSSLGAVAVHYGSPRTQDVGLYVVVGNSAGEVSVARLGAGRRGRDEIWTIELRVVSAAHAASLLAAETETMDVVTTVVAAIGDEPQLAFNGVAPLDGLRTVTVETVELLGVDDNDGVTAGAMIELRAVWTSP